MTMTMTEEQMENPKNFIDYLKSVNPNYDFSLIEKAYNTAYAQHKGQKRKSGEPYIIHPVETAKILAELGMDESTIVAGLLHDVVEDTDYTTEQMKENFGPGVAVLVNGVTKLGSLVFNTREEEQAENLRKMFLAMSRDIRVLIIKLADRLHNMRTIDFMSPGKIVEKSRETLDIYAPLAGRLGMFNMKFELEDIALAHLEPQIYDYLKHQINERKESRDKNVQKIIEELRSQLDTLGIHYEVYGRSKHFYSIYKKMRDKHKQLEEIFDLMAVRVLVDTVPDCYAVLGIVHTTWTPVPGRFKDYIARPKSNMYQSLHTTVFGDDKQLFEIQIRTYEMHRIAEYGIAAHWKYKEGTRSNQEDEKLAWLRQSLELINDSDDSTEFVQKLKVDLFSNQVFVYTPTGKVIELPAGSTPVDFAYKIHSQVGNKCIGAKINGRMVTIDHTLENGDIVEIITSANSRGPSIDWLKIAKSSHARNKIRQWFKKENKSENVEKGRSMLDKYIRRKGYNTKQIIKPHRINRVAKELKQASAEDLYSSIGYGGTMLSKVLDLLVKFYEEETNAEQIKKIPNFESKQTKSKSEDTGGISIKGVSNVLVRLAKCCNPVPGDEIIGFTTKGRGVSVHRADCTNMAALPDKEKQRFIDVQWDVDNSSRSFETDMSIVTDDRKGVYADILKICDNMDVDIAKVNAQKNADSTGSVHMAVLISTKEQMAQLMSRLKALAGVLEVRRGSV